MDDEKPALVTGKLRLSGLLTCASVSEAAIVHQYLPEHIRLSRAEPGCLSFDISETDDPFTFEVMEAFRDREAFDLHQARTRESDWFMATRGILRDFRVEEVGD